MDLSCQAHRFTAPGLEELVGVAAFGHQHVGHQAAEPAQKPPVVIIDGVQGEDHHSHVVAAVQQRDVHPDPVYLRHLDRGRLQEGGAGGGARDRFGTCGRSAAYPVAAPAAAVRSPVGESRHPGRRLWPPPPRSVGRSAAAAFRVLDPAAHPEVAHRSLPTDPAFPSQDVTRSAPCVPPFRGISYILHRKDGNRRMVWCTHGTIPR